MPGHEYWITFLLAIGSDLLKLANSPGSSVFALIGPATSAIQAVYACASGKVTFRRFPRTTQPNIDAIRERLRGSLVRIWIMQLVLGLVDFVLVIRLYVFDPIPKVGNPPEQTPNLQQSMFLILLTLLSVGSIVLAVIQLRKASRLEKWTPRP
jgi:hypothetical protein